MYKRVTQIERQVTQYQTGLATVEQDYNHLALQVAEMDTTVALQVAEMDTTVGEHNNRLGRTEFGLGEAARDVFTPGGMKTLFPIFENSCFLFKQELAVANN